MMKKIINNKSVIKLKVKNFDSVVLFDNEKNQLDTTSIIGDERYSKEFLRLIDSNGVYITEKSKLYVLSDVYVLFPYGIIFTDKDVLDQSIYNVNLNCFNIDGQDRHSEIFLPFDSGKIEEVEVVSFLMAGGFSQNYYHWHADILPRLSALDYLDVNELTLVFSQLNSFQSSTLKYMGLRIPRIKQKEVVGNKLLFFKSLYYAPFFAGKYPLLSPRLAKFYNEISIDTKKNDSNISKYLFITRENNNRRLLLNEKELISVLKKKWDFTVIDPGNYSYEEQVSMFRGAKVMIGAHGAGFTNLLYADSSATVIELFADKYLNIGLQRLAISKSMKYYYIVGTTVEYNLNHIHDLKYTVDIDEVVRLLRGVI